jgi:HK97 family phage major capsid protein
MRALSEASGGTVIPPTEFDSQLVTKLQTMTSVRNLCRKISLGSFAREVAFEDTTGTAYWTGENSAPSSETGSTFSKITLTPKRLSCLLRVSNELVADADARGGNFGISSILSEQFARIFAQTEETALLSASNVSGAPTSLLTTSGLATSAASQTSVTAAQIITWVYSLPRQYRAHPSVAIVTNDATLAAIRALAASGLYFWENGYSKGGAGLAPEPDRLLGIPVVTSAAMPTIPTSGTTSTKVALIGAWDYCVMGTTGNYELKVLRERYADTNETGYIANMRMDCKLLLPGLAFSALQCQT